MDIIIIIIMSMRTIRMIIVPLDIMGLCISTGSSGSSVSGTRSSHDSFRIRRRGDTKRRRITTGHHHHEARRGRAGLRMRKIAFDLLCGWCFVGWWCWWWSSRNCSIILFILLCLDQLIQEQKNHPKDRRVVGSKRKDKNHHHDVEVINGIHNR